MVTHPPSPGPETSAAATGDDTEHAQQLDLELPESLRSSYRDLEPLAALEAEFACPLARAVEKASGQTAVLASLGAHRAHFDDRLEIYDECTKAWPEHYGIPTVLDSASPETLTPYVAWAVETGENLRSKLLTRQNLPQQSALEIARAVAETLAELHRFGMRAEHLTPAAVWLGPAGICQIVGLGLGAPSRELLGEGQRYRAPERLRRGSSSMAERILANDLAERSDVWSLGVILLELLEGRPRLSSRSADDLALEQAEISWRPPGHLGHELASLLGAMLTLDPVGRTLSAEEVAARLDDQLIEHQVTASRGQARSSTGAASVAAASSISPSASTPSISSDGSEDPPLPIPASPRRTTDWRQAVRSVQDRRRAFEMEDLTPTWKIWLLPGIGLALVLFALWLLLSLQAPL